MLIKLNTATIIRGEYPTMWLPQLAGQWIQKASQREMIRTVKRGELLWIWRFCWDFFLHKPHSFWNLFLCQLHGPYLEKASSENFIKLHTFRVFLWSQMSYQRITSEGVSWYDFGFLSISQPEKLRCQSIWHKCFDKRPKNISKKKRTIRDHNFGYNSHFCEKFLSWIVALASLAELVRSDVSFLLLSFVASLWKSESFSLFEDNLKKCDKTKYVIIFIQIKLLIT